MARGAILAVIALGLSAWLIWKIVRVLSDSPNGQVMILLALFALLLVGLTLAGMGKFSFTKTI